MATTISGLNVATLEAEIQEGMRVGMLPMNALSIGVETEGKIVSDKCYVPVTTDPTSQVKVPGTATTDDGAVAGKLVTLDQPREAAFKLIEGSVPRSMAQAAANKLARGAAYNLCKGALNYAFGLVKIAQFPDSIIVPPADFGSNDLGTLWEKAEVKGLGAERALVLNAVYAGRVISASDLAIILATSGDQSFKTGVLPPLFGFNSYTYASLPTNSENLAGLVIDKRSIAMGFAPLSDLLDVGQGAIEFQQDITEPQSGVTVRFRIVSNGDAGYMKGIVSFLYGGSFLQDGAIRIQSAIV